jgi:hypothetical protein
VEVKAFNLIWLPDTATGFSYRVDSRLGTEPSVVNLISNPGNSIFTYRIPSFTIPPGIGILYKMPS